MRTQLTRIPAGGPDDVSGLLAAIEAGRIAPQRIRAILGKTEGNGCVNDFTRALATRALRQALARCLDRDEDAVAAEVALVMSGGTEGGLSPHWLVFETDERPAPAAAGASDAAPGLALGVGFSRAMQPEQIGRMAQVEITAEAVRQAMDRAGLRDPAGVHFVQIKCPLLTAARALEAANRGHTVVTQDTYASMGYSRGASALGVALALEEIAPGRLDDSVICQDYRLYSGRASTSAGIELMRAEVLVLGNSPDWDSDFVIGHAVMADAIDVAAVDRALAAMGHPSQDGGASPTLVAALAKAEAARDGLIRGRRHVMLDDSDIPASRHARAFVGGALAGRLGDTALFVSGGAEHQGPDGGGPLALIARRD